MPTAWPCAMVFLLLCSGCASPRAAAADVTQPPPSLSQQPEETPAQVKVIRVPVGHAWVAAVELKLWRTADAVPPQFATHFPADFDFEHFSLAGPDSAAGVREVVIVDATVAEGGEGEGLLIDATDLLSSACEPCRGVHERNVQERPAPEPVYLWKIPSTAKQALLRVNPQVCPPCVVH